MTRVLLLDTAFAALPIHDWLVTEGYEVWTIGNRPEDVLARRDPEHYIQANYADAREVQAHIDRLSIELVVPGCTDISIETAQKLHLQESRMDSAETYLKLADKTAFRSLCADLNLPAPRRVEIDSFPMQGQFIAKPTDSFSGRGISVFDGANVTSAEEALAEARSESRRGEALIETFTEGQLHSYSCFIENRSVTDGVIVREAGSVSPYVVDTSYVRDDFPSEGLDILNDVLGRLARHLKLVDGLLHVQFIWDGTTPWLIELSRRCPGDLYPKLIELSTGLPHAARYASYFVGQGLSADPIKRRFILRHTITAGHGSYEGIWFNGSAPVVEMHPLAATGRPTPPSTRTDRVALLFLELEDASALANHYDFYCSRAAYATSS